MNSLTDINILIIDNYDSYTFNLINTLQSCILHSELKNYYKLKVSVIRNNSFSWKILEEKYLNSFHGIILSPGPGTPENPNDFGLCGDLLRNQVNLPIFGVCLGHQGLAHYFGAKVVRCHEPYHGVVHQMQQIPLPSHINPNWNLFKDLDEFFSVTRYHSLCVDSDLPDCLIPTCIANDSRDPFPTLMGLQHISLPYFGVQFHPESICTKTGEIMMRNFIDICTEYSKNLDIPTNFNNFILENSILISSLPTSPKTSMTHSSLSSTKFQPYAIPISTHHLSSNQLSQLFELLYGSCPNPFWLDSSKEAGQNHPGYHYGIRTSYMGNFNTEGSVTIDYQVYNKNLKISKLATETSKAQLLYETHLDHHTNSSTLWDWVEDLMNHLNTPEKVAIFSLDEIQYSENIASYKYDYGYCGGLVGYFGYEMKQESLPNYVSTTQQTLNYPDSTFGFPDRFITIDHNQDILWLVGMVNETKSTPDFTSPSAVGATLGNVLGCSLSEFSQWAKETYNELTQFNGLLKTHGSLTPLSPPKPIPCLNTLRHHDYFKMDLEEQEYSHRIRSAQELIRSGETYEVCLTTQLRLNPTLAACPWTPLELYFTLRRTNPAPFSAFLNFPKVSICSSSPEQFLRIHSDGELVMKPIKGTVPRCKPSTLQPNYPNLSESQLQVLADAEDLKRHDKLQDSIKDQAENLMIVDLIRNDLTTIAIPHSVKVPRLMKVETYETVHQMVTTVRAQLSHNRSGVRALRTCFPPGSMTGAPKLRTCEILDQLEDGKPRGIYSGALGYISLSGTLDFSVVIRTVVVDNQTHETTVGAGGAIIIMSECDDEFQEMLTKAYSTVTSINQTVEKFID